MAKNQESINQSLFDLLRSRGYGPTMLDTSGKEIPIPEEAEVFQFQFVKDGKEYGTVTISVDGLHKLVVYFGDDVANSEKEIGGNGSESWYQLLNHLKRFSQQHQLSFELKNTDHLKYDMAKRDHMKKQEKIAEGYHSMGKKASYSDAVPTTKIIIQHNRNIEEGEQRYRNIAKIFVENTSGERFLVPTTKPGIARVYARHVAEGGTPYDSRGQHITSLVEEHTKMAGFVRATRNGQFNESTQLLVSEAVNHYQSLRESLGKMAGHRGYTAYFESWTPTLNEETEEDNSINELFVQETLDPRIESVMPILNKLQKKLGEMKEVDALSEWADNLIDEGAAVNAQQNSDSPTMRGSPAMAHYAAQLDKDLDESDVTAINPIAIPEEEEDLEESGLQAYLGDKKYGKDGMEALRKAGQDHAGEKKMQNIRAKYSSKEDPVSEEVDTGEYDARKHTPNSEEDDDAYFANFRAKLQQYAKDREEEDLKKGFRAGEEVDEGLDADQKRVGQLGPTEKVKNNNIGKLVGANENFINTDDQAVVTEEEGQEDLDAILRIVRK